MITSCAAENAPLTIHGVRLTRAHPVCACAVAFTVLRIRAGATASSIAERAIRTARRDTPVAIDSTTRYSINGDPNRVARMPGLRRLAVPSDRRACRRCHARQEDVVALAQTRRGVGSIDRYDPHHTAAYTLNARSEPGALRPRLDLNPHQN